MNDIIEILKLEKQRNDLLKDLDRKNKLLLRAMNLIRAFLFCENMICAPELVRKFCDAIEKEIS